MQIESKPQDDLTLGIETEDEERESSTVRRTLLNLMEVAAVVTQLPNNVPARTRYVLAT